MKKTVIGVTPLWDGERDSYWMLPGYLEGLELAGALPITLPLTEDEQDISRLLSLCDGVLFTGGQDVSPELYGEKPRQACGEICKKRDAFDFRFIYVERIAKRQTDLSIIEKFFYSIRRVLYQV